MAEFIVMLLLIAISGGGGYLFARSKYRAMPDMFDAGPDIAPEADGNSEK